MKETIVVDGVEYVRKDSIRQDAVSSDNNLPYQIVRTRFAGVFAGYVESRAEQEAVMRNARRLWYWEGAASLSQLAEEGVSRPENCKFPQKVDKVQLFEVIEILNCSKKAQESIEGVKEWKE